MTNKTDELDPQLKTIAEKAVEHSRDLSNKLPLLGHVTWLYTQSPQHKHYFLQDIESRVLPPIVTEQCKIYLRSSGGSLPLAFVSWAYMSEEAEQHYVQSQRIAPGDWKSGDRIWLIDLLTPFGGAAEVITDLSEKIHKDKAVNLLYPDDSGNIGKITLGELLSKSKPTPEKKTAMDTSTEPVRH